jgi:uncharacterized membrane protein
MPPVGYSCILKRLDRSGGINSMESSRRTIEIRAPRAKVFELLNRFDQLRPLLKSVAEVHPLKPSRSRWIAKGPFFQNIHFCANLCDVRQGERLGWDLSFEPSRLLPGRATGKASFELQETGRDTTLLKLSLSFNALDEAGKKSAPLLYAVRYPDADIETALQRIKDHLEHTA